MTDLTPHPVLSPVPQLETNTLALGGTGNPMNQQAQALLNRTEFLGNAISSQALSIDDLEDFKALISSVNGAQNLGESRYSGSIQSSLNALPYYASLAGLGQGADDIAALQALVNIIAIGGGGHLIMDTDLDVLISDSLYVKSNMEITWTGRGYLKATQSTTNGAVIVVYSGDSLAAGRTFNVILNNPQIDGNNLGWPSLPAGENGIGGTNCEHVRVYGGHVKNCRRGTSSATGAGGKGIQFESGVHDIKVLGTIVDTCSILCETGGVPNVVTGPVIDQYRVGTAIQYDLIGRNCGRVVSLNYQFTPPAAPEVVNCDIKVLAFESGREDVAGTEQDFGALVFDRYGNGKVEITLVNSAAYGSIYAPIRGRRGVNNKFEVNYIGTCEFLVSHNSTFNSSGTMSGNRFAVRHHGTCNQYALGGPAGESVASLNNEWDIQTSTVTTGLVEPAWQYSGFNGKFTNPNGVVIQGALSAIGGSVFSNTYPSASYALAGTVRFNGITVSIGSGVQVMDSPDNIEIRRSGAARVTAHSTGVGLTGRVGMQLTSASPVGATSAGKIAIYDVTGTTIIGYVPLFTT